LHLTHFVSILITSLLVVVAAHLSPVVSGRPSLRRLNLCGLSLTLGGYLDLFLDEGLVVGRAAALALSQAVQALALGDLDTSVLTDDLAILVIHTELALHVLLLLLLTLV